MSLTIPAVNRHIKLKRASCPEKERRSWELVRIKNGSNKVLRVEFKMPVEDGIGQTNETAFYELPPGKQWDEVPMRLAWYIFGDPDLRPGQKRRPVEGTQKSWGKELQRLMHMHGAWKWNPMLNNGAGHLPGGLVYDEDSVWAAIKRGDIWCPEIVWEHGKGEVYYAGAEFVVAPKSVPISDLVAEDGARPGRAAAISARVSELMEESGEVAVPRRR